MTLEKLSKLNVKIWTNDGYKDLDRRQLCIKIQERLFVYESFFWEVSGKIILRTEFNYLCLRYGSISFGLSRDFYDNEFKDLREVEIIDVLFDYVDDGGL